MQQLANVGNALKRAFRVEAEDVSRVDAATTDAQSVENLITPSSPKELLRERFEGEGLPLLVLIPQLLA